MTTNLRIFPSYGMSHVCSSASNCKCVYIMAYRLHIRWVLNPFFWFYSILSSSSHVDYGMSTSFYLNAMKDIKEGNFQNISYSSHFSIFCQKKITFKSERSFFENICFSNFSLSLNTCFCIDVCGLVCAFRTNTTIRNQKKLSDSCFKLLLMHTMRNFSGYVALYWQVRLLHSSLSNALHVFLFSSRYHSLSILVPSRQHRLQLCMYIFLVHLPER